MQQYAGPSPAWRGLSGGGCPPVAGAAVAGALGGAEAAAQRERDAANQLPRVQPGAAARRHAAATHDLNLAGAGAVAAAVCLAVSQSAAVGLAHAQRGHGRRGLAARQAAL